VTMEIGPVQLIVLGFQEPDFRGEIAAELERLRANDTVKVIDALAVYKDAAGEVDVQRLSNLTDDEAVEFGSVVGALVGLGAGGEQGFADGAETGAALGAARVPFFDEAELGDVIGDLSPDSAAALILLEHHWAVALRDAVYRAGGFRISDGFISPFDLVSVGLVTSEEARELAEQESRPTAGA